MLLLDENLSPKLAARLDGEFPGTKHVLHVGLDNDDDSKIWEYAKCEGYTIVTKDRDYLDFSRKHGHPPKVILLSIGNCRLTVLETFLKQHQVEIIAFVDDQNSGLLQL